ncbi:MAG: hypothetical protein JRI23_32375 [Deltaproteobacteria bacterium]|jgi:hypothetical protein|nr:hypothetical protein [Deltaproteobacteria bacterium]MBW2536941.1 hypothetical protein [Deltaproteobacteria bacterium]
MPEPISLCIENTEDLSDEAHFIRCVALEGNRAGLAIDPSGRPLWMDTDGCACELWVSADDQLILRRPEGAAPSRVHRSGRSLDVPVGKPVVVLDQDEIEIGGVMLRLHVHGFTTEVHPPTPFVPPRAAAAALAAAVALAGAASCDAPGPKGPTHEPVATSAPTVSIESTTTEATVTTATTTATETTAATTTSAAAIPTATDTKTVPTKPPIEVREVPPAPPLPEDMR